METLKNIDQLLSDPKSNKNLTLIAGPCQIESLEHCRTIAKALKEITSEHKNIDFVFKSSFDKANRTSIEGKRGIGAQQGLEILKAIRDEFEVPVITDIHLPEQAALAATYVDILQIPAFLCRQTDLLIAAGETGKIINIKKGQFLHPSDMQHVAKKVSSTGNKKIFLCERGTCFGYRELIVDFKGIKTMSDFGFPVIFDATHSVMTMGGESGKSGGAREFIGTLTKAAVAAGVHGLFIECHDNPSAAPSDGASMLELKNLAPLLKEITNIKEAIHR